MKFKFLIITTLFSFAVCSQSNFSPDEIKILESKKQSPTFFKVNTENDDLEYYSNKYIQIPLTSYDYGYVSILRFYLTKVEDEIYLKPLIFKQKLTKNGISVDFEKMICIVGNTKDIKYGNYKKFEHIPTKKSEDGSIIFSGNKIFEMFKYSTNEFKNIEMKFYDRSGKQIVKYKLQASKIKSKFKGVINTYIAFRNEFKSYNSATLTNKNSVNPIQKSGLCENIVIRPDKFTGDTTYYTSINENVNFIKFKSASNEIKYYISLKTTGATANVNIKGVIILLDNGKKIIKENSEISVDVNDKAEYVYSSFIELNEDELTLLKNNLITDYRLYIYDTQLTDYESNRYRTLLNCIHK